MSGHIFLVQRGNLAKAVISAMSSWRSGQFSTCPSCCGKYLPTSHKAINIFPREVKHMVEEEFERRRRLKGRLLRQRGSKPHDVIFEDRHKTRNFNVSFMNSVRQAMLSEPEVRAKVVGRGINITRVEVASDYETVKVFWITTTLEKEEETTRALQECEESIRGSVERSSNIGQVPKIIFVKDTKYLVQDTLEDEFRKIQQMQAAYTPDISQRDKEQLDAVCQMRKRSDVLRLDRDAIFSQIVLTLQKAKACHRISTKPGLNDPTPAYLGYSERAELLETPVKKYLGSRNKQLFISEGILKSNTQKT